MARQEMSRQELQPRGKATREQFEPPSVAMERLQFEAFPVKNGKMAPKLVTKAEMISEGSPDTEIEGDVTIIQNAESFPFLKLASETRVEIYKYLLAADRKVRFVKLPKQRRWKGISFESRHSNILQVSKKIYNEAIVVLYAFNKFTIYAHQAGCRSLSPLRHIRKKHLDLITNITLKTWSPNFEFDSKRGKWRIVSKPIVPPNGTSKGTFNPLVMWGLSQCTKLRFLTIEMTLDMYERADKVAERGREIKSDWPPLKELFAVKGLESIRLIDIVGIPQSQPQLRRAKKQIEKVLTTELLKPREDAA